MPLTVLYDAGCPLCTRFRDWLAAQSCLVGVDLVAAGSPQAQQRFPTLDHTRTLDEITVVADDGAIYVNEHAWVMCLWATATHRSLAERLARPGWLPLARVTAHAAAGLRSLTTSTTAGGDYGDACAGSCEPLPQG